MLLEVGFRSRSGEASFVCWGEVVRGIYGAAKENGWPSLLRGLQVVKGDGGVVPVRAGMRSERRELRGSKTLKITARNFVPGTAAH